MVEETYLVLSVLIRSVCEVATRVLCRIDAFARAATRPTRW
jgi:hypothetical protein